MAKKDKQVLPPSGAGLVRYFEEETKGPKPVSYTHLDVYKRQV